MAQIKVDEVMDHLSSEVRGALADAMRQVAPDAEYDANALYLSFKRALYSRCRIWETVPDRYVKA